MGKKLSYEFVRSGFKDGGYKLLTNDYEKSGKKLEYICNNGHYGTISWDSWRDGHRCSLCFGNRKLSIGYIRNAFANENYTLLTKKYKNAYQKLLYVCPKGHKNSIMWCSWHNGGRCSYCAGVGKLTLNMIKEEFEKGGYILLTKIYTGNSQKLLYRCPNGHEHRISWSNWKRGHRCGVCYNTIYRFGKTSPNWNGGISCEPYCDAWADKEFKNDIKERDNHKCQNPCCSGDFENDIVVHHINYNKKNCHPNNLITLCRSCNSRANVNRDFWKDLYTGLIRSNQHATI